MLAAIIRVNSHASFCNDLITSDGAKRAAKISQTRDSLSSFIAIFILWMKSSALGVDTSKNWVLATLASQFFDASSIQFLSIQHSATSKNGHSERLSLVTDCWLLNTDYSLWDFLLAFCASFSISSIPSFVLSSM